MHSMIMISLISIANQHKTMQIKWIISWTEAVLSSTELGNVFPCTVQSLKVCDFSRMNRRVSERACLHNRIERACLHNRIGWKWCKFSRPECATSQRDVTRDCDIIG